VQILRNGTRRRANFLIHEAARPYARDITAISADSRC
jgi:hypothetical protein